MPVVILRAWDPNWKMNNWIQPQHLSPQEADQFLEWRGGLAQKRAAEERARQMAEEVCGIVI